MKKIVCFGDSNTYGLIPGTTNKRYNEFVRYPKIVAEILGSSYKVIEEGLIGRTTIYDDPRGGRIGINDVYKILDYNPDYLIVMLGTNDIKRNNAKTEDEVRNAMNLFLSKLNNKKLKLIIVSPIHLSSNISKLDKEYNYNSYCLSKKLKNIYFDLSKEFNAIFLDASNFSKPGIDGEHLTKAGHIKLGNAIANVILEN